MPNILCPKCDSTLAIADQSVGQMVQCGSCHQIAGIILGGIGILLFIGAFALNIGMNAAGGGGGGRFNNQNRFN